MFKILAISLVLIFGSSCDPDKVVEQELPTHTEVHYISTMPVMAIECGQACILVLDPSTDNFIATFIDGSTITFIADDPQLHL